MVTRPTFAEALRAWNAALSQRGLPTDLVWIFDENLCFEKDAAASPAFKLGFQTLFSPPPPDAEKIAYDYFCAFEAPLVFYRIGSARGKSVCLMLCDHWFESKSENDGYQRREDWLIWFRPGGKEDVEEITMPNGALTIRHVRRSPTNSAGNGASCGIARSTISISA